MKTKMTRVGEPYLFEFENQEGHKVLMDASPSTGGTDNGFRPMELLAGSLAGCIAIDVISILNKQRSNPDLFEIHVDAKRKDATPAPFEHIQLTVAVDASIDAEKLDKNVQLVIDKYCSVASSLDPTIVIEHQIQKK